MMPYFLNPAIMNLRAVIQNIPCNISVAPPNEEKLAPQLEEWLSAQPHAAYDATTLAKIFGVSNRAINGSIVSVINAS